MRKTKLFKRWKQNQGGSVSIESALILPILILLYFGMLDMTKLIGDYRKTSTISGIVADLVGQNTGPVYFPSNDTDNAMANIKDYFNIAPMVMVPKTDNKLRIVVAGFGMNGTNFQRLWRVDNGGTATCSVTSNDAKVIEEMRTLSEDTRDVIFVQACTESTLYYGTILGGLITPLEDDKIPVGQYVLVTPRTSNFKPCYTNPATVSGASTCPNT